MKLLEEQTYMPPPAEYLYARLGRRRHRLASGPGPPQDARLREERNWVYRRLEVGLLRALTPLYEYDALQTLVLGLRYLAAGEATKLEGLLAQSLLSGRLRQRLRGAREVLPVLDGIETLLENEYPFCRGLGAIWLRQGPGGVEQQLLGGYLRYAVRQSRVGQVRDLLRHVLDMRNLLALYKHLQWQLPQAPPLLDGGWIAPARCARFWKERDLAGLLDFAGRQSGHQGEVRRGAIGEILELGVTQRLRRRAREPLQIGVLIEFLWSCRRQLQEREAGRDG